MTFHQLLSKPTAEEKFQALFFAAEMKRAQVVVILLDQERTNLPDARKTVLDAQAAYLKARPEAGSASSPVPKLVVGVARRCLETWLLVDPDARETVFGCRDPDPFSGDPEERPAPRELKRQLKEFCKPRNLKEHHARRTLAATAKPEVLKKRCPKSYAPFLADIKRELACRT